MLNHSSGLLNEHKCSGADLYALLSECLFQHDYRNLEIWDWMWFKLLLMYHHSQHQMKPWRQNMLSERGKRFSSFFFFSKAESSESFIVSCKPNVAPRIRCNVHVPFYARLEFMFLPALFLPISAWLQPNRVDQFMQRHIVPYGAHLNNQGYLMRPWGR